MRVIVFVLMCVVFGAGAICQEQKAEPADVTGPWLLKVQHPFGQDDIRLQLKQEGDKIAGEGRYGREVITLKGEVKGLTFAFTLTSEANGTTATSHYTGEIDKSFASMKGKWQTSDQEVSSTWTATRVKQGEPRNGHVTRPLP